MSDCIDREAFLEDIHIAIPDDGSVYRQGQNDALQWAREIALSEPAVTPTTVVRTESRCSQWDERRMPGGGAAYWVCARCGQAQDRQSEFCPHCGARMNGGDKQ